MIDPITGKEIGAQIAEVKAEVKRTAEERIAALEVKLAKAERVLVALTGHSDPLSLG